MANDKKLILLNVGGTSILTHRATLAKSTPSSSPLHRICNNSTNIDWDRDAKGAYIIDRDPALFQPILNYFRTGKLILNRDIPEEAVLTEAEYYHLPEVIRILKQRISYKFHFGRYFNHYGQYLHQLDGPDQPLMTAPTNQLVGPQQQQQPQLEQQQHQHQNQFQLKQQVYPNNRFFTGSLNNQPLMTGSSFSNGIAAPSLPSSSSSSSSKSTSSSSSSTVSSNIVVPQTSADSLIFQQDYLTNYVNKILKDADYDHQTCTTFS